MTPGGVPVVGLGERLPALQSCSQNPWEAGVGGTEWRGEAWRDRRRLEGEARAGEDKAAGSFCDLSPLTHMVSCDLSQASGGHFLAEATLTNRGEKREMAKKPRNDALWPRGAAKASQVILMRHQSWGPQLWSEVKT